MFFLSSHTMLALTPIGDVNEVCNFQTDRIDVIFWKSHHEQETIFENSLEFDL